jgi:hypothetical protein
MEAQDGGIQMTEKHVPLSLKGLHRRYPASRRAKDGIAIELARVNGIRRLVIMVPNGIFPQGLEVESELQSAQWHGRWDIPERDRDKKTIESERVGVCPLSARNAAWVRSQWPELAPRTNPGIPVSIGLGDRLGKASAGHLKALEGMSVFPVLAQ